MRMGGASKNFRRIDVNELDLQSLNQKQGQVDDPDGRPDGFE
jgi:hypothetical protein